MAADRKDTSRSFLELWGDNSPHTPDDFVSEDYVNHQFPDATGGTASLSLQEYRALLTGFHAGFSAIKFEPLLQVAEGDVVCTRWRMTAVHSGRFADLEPTGKTTSWTGVQTDRYDGDKIVETWCEWDKYSFLEGLGLVSSP